MYTQVYLTLEIVCFAGVIPILSGGSDVVTFRSIVPFFAHKVLKIILYVQCLSDENIQVLAKVLLYMPLDV